MKTTILKDKDVAEEWQRGETFKIHFSLVNTNRNVLQYLQSCKDYCSDYLYDTFALDKNKDKNLGKDKPRFLIRLPKKYKNSYLETVESILDLLHQVEKDLNFKNKTVIYRVKWDKKESNITESDFCVIGANEWLYCLPLFSLFQTIIRGVCGLHTKGEDYKKTFKNIVKNPDITTDYISDKSYLSQGIFFLQLYIKYGYTKFFYGNGDIEGFNLNWKKSAHGASSHSSGISGLYIKIFGKASDSYVLHKHYYRPELLRELENLEGKILFPSFMTGKPADPQEDLTKLGVNSLYLD